METDKETDNTFAVLPVGDCTSLSSMVAEIKRIVRVADLALNGDLQAMQVTAANAPPLRKACAVGASTWNWLMGQLRDDGLERSPSAAKRQPATTR